MHRLAVLTTKPLSTARAKDPILIKSLLQRQQYIALLNNEPQYITDEILSKVLEAEPSLNETKQQQRADALLNYFLECDMKLKGYLMTSLLPAARRIVQSISITSPTCKTWKMLKAEFEGHTTFSLVQNLEVIFHKRYDVKTRVTAIITEHEDHFRRLEAGGLKFHEHVKIYALIKALPSYYHSFRNNMTAQGLEEMSYKKMF